MWQGGIRGHGFPFPQRLLLGGVFGEHHELFLEEQFQVFKPVSHLGFCSRTFLVFRGHVDVIGTSDLVKVLPCDSCAYGAYSGF